MRVLHIINGEFYSGAERVQDILVQLLPEFGFEAHLACIKPGLFPKNCRCGKELLHEFPMQSKFDILKALHIARYLKENEFALIHTHTPRAVLLGRIASLVSGLPMVHHVHSPTERDTEQGLRNAVNAFLERLSISGPIQLIPVSVSLARHLTEQGFSREQVNVVPNGVPTSHPLSMRARPSAPWTIGMVALYRPRKGVEILLEAVAHLQRLHPIRLLLVGPFETREYEREIRFMAQNLGVGDLVEWTGFTDDVNTQLRRMDVFVLPSLFGEGMPMVILEAMAAGVPVVGARVEGIPEVLQDGKSGLLVAPGNAEELARAIESMISGQTDWKKIREAAYQRQVEMFSDYSMARGVAEVYKQVLMR
jgi:glycosyltransferase involved in cell wall biosynthesis